MPLRAQTRRTTTRSWLLAAAALALTLTALSSSVASSRSHPAESTPAPSKPTVVLVHGAFADASGWSTVISRLQRRGYPVIAPPNPLRGVAGDTAYIKSVLATVTGPIVLVGHSYGGFVITNAALDNPNVKALVYIAAYAPDEGDTVQGLNMLGSGSKIGPDTLDVRTVPGPSGTDVQEALIKPTAFADVFAADVPARTAAVMAASQRPAALATLGQPSGPPAWKSIPSWYLVAGRDNAIGTAAERIMAKRIGAHTVELTNASHAVLVSHPDDTTDLILAAARATN